MSIQDRRHCHQSPTREGSNWLWKSSLSTYLVLAELYAQSHLQNVDYLKPAQRMTFSLDPLSRPASVWDTGGLIHRDQRPPV
ncbi:hypothetical protein AVEN_28124-1 [Araneus ventricosus]|uniref:Uncharacterized protein n=1 Tax=Araneus ventricosus TaxID=182803 RepID=A0A4Y2ML09_ARAVE|nr:hypothetical protein AVEN_28124-1 [Araneus ventricosus]